MAKKTKRKLPDNVPTHVAIILDGNGRWARARGLPRHAGHQAGVRNLRRVIEASHEFGIKFLTIFAFSTENWTRPAEEVRGLMNLMEEVIGRELPKLHENGVQIRHLGRLEQLRPTLQKKVLDAIELTRHNDRLILNVAWNYGGRDEIVHAIQRMIAEGVDSSEVTDELVSRYLYTAGCPDPDLVIRTSGENRMSNFLTWQAAYAELYVTPTYWPDFGRDELLEALCEYASRERRFGGVPSTSSQS
jgi:undecaprenyl diphosphate synthase